MSDESEEEWASLSLSQSQDSVVVVNNSKTIKKGKDTKPVARRTEAVIRKEMLDTGAILLVLERKDGKRVDYQPWRRIERYGFHVTRQGCLIPHSQYWPGKGQTDLKVLLFL